MFLKLKVVFQASYIKEYKLSGGVHIGVNVHAVLPLLNNSQRPAQVQTCPSECAIDWDEPRWQGALTFFCVIVRAVLSTVWKASPQTLLLLCLCWWTLS